MVRSSGSYVLTRFQLIVDISVYGSVRRNVGVRIYACVAGLLRYGELI
jgi:hypothetical protein